jgi:hypothetical protein
VAEVPVGAFQPLDEAGVGCVHIGLWHKGYGIPLSGIEQDGTLMCRRQARAVRQDEP